LTSCRLSLAVALGSAIFLSGCGDDEPAPTPAPTPAPRFARYLDCQGVNLCGHLQIASGLSDAEGWAANASLLHALTPRKPPLQGTSNCIAPVDPAGSDTILGCFNFEGFDATKLKSGDTVEKRQMRAQVHAWDSIAVCAGSEGIEDYVTQACALAAGPRKLMDDVRAGGGDLMAMKAKLETEGYSVGVYDQIAELQLVVCAGADRKWKFSKPEDFVAKCGSKAAIVEHV